MELRPLTFLAGANSSGKSSMMQPLLMLKQTLEVSYDPGALLLNGPNVRFTSADQIFFHTHAKGEKKVQEFGVGFSSGSDESLDIAYERRPGLPVELKSQQVITEGKTINLTPGMSEKEIVAAIPGLGATRHPMRSIRAGKSEVAVVRDRFSLHPTVRFGGGASGWTYRDRGPGAIELERYLRRLIHLPGLRGNPARNYPVTAVGKVFPGTFDAYTASVVANWQTEKNKPKLQALGKDLMELGLTWKVIAVPLNDTQVELRVGRLPKPIRGGAQDLVSIADVGFGVSQTLPVIVALHAAEEGQTVYLEQPEIHLHPRAQVAMAKVLSRAVRRGVRLIVETHSSLLLLGVQTLVASDDGLTPTDVKLHWFQRSAEDGSTFLTSADLDETGAFGDWPEDFGDVTMDAENRYLTAAEARLDDARR